METGKVHFQTWVPAGGFKLERRKGKTPEGAVLTTDWLVPDWAEDDVAAAHPCAEQPCLHRILADCRHNQVLRLAGWYGLLTATGKAARADALPPEPVDIWHREIRALRNATALWDAIAAEHVAELRRLLPQHQAAKGKELFRLAREHLARRVTEKMAGGRFELIAPPDKGPSQFVIRYRPVKLIDAIWQQIRRGDRRHDHMRPMPRAEVRPLVSPERRKKRPPVLLSRLPDAPATLRAGRGCEVRTFRFLTIPMSFQINR